MLSSKGQVFLRQRSIRQLRLAVADDPDSPAARTFAVLTDRARELDRFAKFVPGPETIEEHCSRLEELTLEVERLQQELAGLNAEFRRSRESAGVTPDELAAILPVDAALIDFREYDQYLPHDVEHPTGRWERQYVVFITRKDPPAQMVWLGAAEPINAAVLAWREHYGTGLRDDAATELRRLVWEPLEAHLDGVSTVLISPDGGLNKVPFSALPGAEPETWLIEERVFVTVPAPLLLPEILARDVAQPADPSLLLVGDVDYGADPGWIEPAATDRATAARGGDGLSSWNRLPDSLVEIERIEQTFHEAFDAALVFSLRRAKATEKAFHEQAPQTSYLHLATHGYFAPEELRSVLSVSRADEEAISLFMKQDVSGWHPGLLSGIVLAGANQPPRPERDDGVLTALEVAELDMSGVELVTLSACETGLGQTAGGEGVLGLQRSFHLAGARTTVASVWQVPDAATRALMVEFYENLWQKKLPRGQALRQAQLLMLREGVERGVVQRGSTDADQSAGGSPGTPPYYWAAFVLSGDWR
jgi:CHAT domain-containing protein